VKLFVEEMRSSHCAVCPRHACCIALNPVERRAQDVRRNQSCRLAEGPVITVPTITMEGNANGAPHLDPSADAKKFSGKYAHRTITGGIGHNLPQEAPQAFAQAVVDVDG
jgi:pimeloyl-ACP methyl ester carboxylesterase